MVSHIGILVWIIWIVVLLVAYHTVFITLYFNLTIGLVHELVIAAVLGMLMTWLTLMYWWIPAIIIVLVGIGGSGKTNSKIPLVLAIIIAGAVAFTGISFKKDINKKGAKKDSVQYESNKWNAYGERIGEAVLDEEYSFDEKNGLAI
ncbi:MAG: hypothetical protein J1E62_08340 [Lachnospiraceae bacterium]|nr:hypothetical protein [Lachnospiraceae bacterium]